MMWLVKSSNDWADEMCIEGFAILSNEQFAQWAQLVEAVANKIDSGCTYSWYFGTNEWIDYESGAEFKKIFECEVISDVDAAAIKRVLLEYSNSYGFFPSSQDLKYFLEDNDDL